jgi:putative membrane protein
LGEAADITVMLTGALVAFGHFLAFFTLAAAIVLTLALVSESMSVEAARRVRRADRVAGVSALLLLVFGTLRVLYFEKGGVYYGDNLFFQIKIGLFLLAAVISIYPTTRFMRWKQDLDRGIAPVLDSVQIKKLRRALHWELMLIGGILLSASLMARGFGT